MFNRNRKNYNTEKIMRYGIRKSNFGIASVVVAAGLMFLGASTAQAAETTEESTSISEPKNSQENVDSSTTIKKNDEANSPEYVQTGTEITANKKVIFDNNAGGETQAKAEKYTLTEGVSTNVSMEDRHGARIYKTAPVLNDDIAENPDKNKFTFGIFDFDGNDKSTEYVTLSRSYDSTDANIYIELREKNTNKLKESLTLGSVGETKSFSDPSFTRNGKTPVFSYTASTTGGRDMFNINFGKAGAEFTYRYKLNTGNSNMVGTQVTDANFLVPQFHDQTTYYMVINPSNASYDSTKADTDTASQTYVPDHTEKTLATFVQTALDGQNYQASGIREFEGYKLYQLASPAGVNGTIFPSYPVGFQFRNAFGGQWKRIIEVVGPNNTTVVKAYVRNPDSTAPNTQANNNETNLVTDGYILAHATEPLAAGAWNTEVVPSKEIFTDKEGRTLIGLSTNNGGAGTANGALTISFKDGNAVPNYTTGNLLLTNPLSNGFEAIYYYVQQGRVLVNYIDSKTGQNIFGTGLTNLDSTETITIEDPKKTKSGASIIDQDWKVPGTDDTYDTTDHKPTYIKTADGKTYKLVTKAGSTDNSISYNENGVVTGDGHATPTGKLLTGTQTVTYAYEEIGGEVTVSYEVAGNPSVKLFTDKASTKVAEKREVKPAETPVGENYDSTTDEFYPETLYGEDGTAYTRVAANKDGVLDGVGVKDGSAPVKGEVISGNQHITYLYVAQPGKVVVNYVDVNNNPISGTGSNEEIITTKGIVDTESGTARTNYNTGEHKPKIITAEDGTTYKITTEAINNDNITSENGVRTKDGDAPETGKVIGGKTQIVTYVYEKVSGNVYVKYETEDGTPITGTVTFDEDQSVEIPTDKGIVDTNDSPINKEYNTNDHKPKTIKTADGKTYELVAYNSDKVINGVKQGEGNAPESGQVTEGDQTVTYVYREVKGGSVVVRYENTNGEEIKDPQTSQPKDTPVGTPYDTTTPDFKPLTIVKDGKTYRLVEKDNGVKSGSDLPSGDVEENKDKVITYVYEEVKGGSVIVRYENTNGEEIKDPQTSQPKDTPVGTPYDTTTPDFKPLTIVKDGKTYRLVEKDNGVKSGSDLPSGDVEENKDKVITYVYEEVKPEPNEPIQPQPNEPNEPVQPQPDEPNEPVQPQPNEPSEPVNPQPNEPNEPVNPQPNEPNEPVNPQPNVPNEPSEPVQPQPNEPSEPVQPQPDEPNKPVQPQPNEPVQLDSNKSSSSINQNISKLPNTGAESNAGTTAGVLGIIGSIFLSIKKRKED